MNKQRNMKFLYILIIVIAILFISIGYASLNTELNISGDVSVLSKEELIISNVIVKTLENDAQELYNPFFEEARANIHVTMPNQSSSITYEIEITNNTSDNFYLNSVEELFNTNGNIKYEFKDANSLFFAPDSTNFIEITFYYDSEVSEDINLSLNISLDFIKVPFFKLDYITSHGFEYIDTGIMNTGDYIFESEFYPANKARGEGFWLFSGRKVTSYTLGLYFFISTQYNFSINTYGGNTGSNSSYHLPKNTWYELYFSRTKYTINSISIPVYSQTIIPENQGTTILLGGNLVNWDGTVDTRHYEGNIKYFKITDAVTGKLLRNFVPVKLNDSNEVLYWDTVEQKYYSNIGTGEFTSP